MLQSHQNNKNDFPEFNLDQLMHYGRKWARDYSIIQIERIILCRYNSKSQERFKASQNVPFEVTKYALVFEISGCTNIDLKEIALGEYPTENDDECTTALKKIEFANQYADQGYHRLFDDSFIDRAYDPNYKPDQDINYFRHWTYILKRPEDPLWPGLLVNEPYWVLYNADEIDIKLDKHIHKEELIKKASEEVLWPLIHHLRKTTDNFKDYRRHQCLKEAIGFYKKNYKKEHYLIPLDYLSDDVFNAMQNQHERNIVGRLISKMLKARDIKVGKREVNVSVYRKAKKKCQMTEKPVK